jgi:hypothetical protein
MAMTAGRAMLKGLGIGITAYLAVIGCLTLFGVDTGGLRSHASCIGTPEAADCGWLADSSSGEPTPRQDEDGIATRTLDGIQRGIQDWGSSLVDASLEFIDEWIHPITGRLVAVSDFVGEHFFRD